MLTGIFVALMKLKKRHIGLWTGYKGEGNWVMHKEKNPNLKIVESYIAPVDISMNGEAIKNGTWIMSTQIFDDKVWKLAEEGKLTGHSISARCVAVNEVE